MTVHGHHAAWRGDMMNGEVNMLNPNAASDGRKSDRVSGYYAHGTRPSTVWVSALATGDEMSCAGVRVRSQ